MTPPPQQILVGMHADRSYFESRCGRSLIINQAKCSTKKALNLTPNLAREQKKEAKVAKKKELAAEKKMKKATANDKKKLRAEKAGVGCDIFSLNLV